MAGSTGFHVAQREAGGACASLKLGEGMLASVVPFGAICPTPLQRHCSSLYPFMLVRTVPKFLLGFSGSTIPSSLELIVLVSAGPNLGPPLPRSAGSPRLSGPYKLRYRGEVIVSRE